MPVFRRSMEDLEPLTNTLQTQWCTLVSCNRVDTGLHNVPVQVSKRSWMGSSTAGCTRWSSGRLPAAPAPFMQDTHRTTVYKAQLTTPPLYSSHKHTGLSHCHHLTNQSAAPQQREALLGKEGARPGLSNLSDSPADCQECEKAREAREGHRS